ncbi:MAG: PTS transporter subunit EIIC [Gemella sp.]|nr:PTS transporter subunit EIIC [Gemella sp.]
MKENKLFSILQRIGRSFMLPVAVLPVAGLLLGIGASFTNPTTIKSYGLEGIFGEGTILNMILTVMSNAGDAIFGTLPLIFAVGVAIGMAKREKEVAALSAMIAFFVMHTATNAMLKTHGMILADGKVADHVLGGTIGSIVGIQSLQMGVFGGIVVGLGVSYLHNKYYQIELPTVLSFFGGSKFIPIISTIVYVFVGIAMYYVWPPVQNGIYALGGLVTGSGYAGTLIYGLIERSLIPFGLHHVFYLPFWQTGVGGTLQVGGELVQGAQNIFFAQLGDPNWNGMFTIDHARFMAGKFPFMIFGLPAAALAMYHVAKPENKKVVGGLLVSAGLTAMLTGITEPIEFSFLFVAPVLYIVHAAFAGISFMMMHILNIPIGQTFSGGLIDFTLFGILQGNAKTNWLTMIPLGLTYSVVYYFVFRTLITKLNLKTPGREDAGEDVKLHSKADYLEKKGATAAAAKDAGVDEQTLLVAQGLGGLENIVDVDACATRLRTTVKDPSLVDEAVLKQSGSLGLVKAGKGVQVIYGPRVSIVKSKLEEYWHNNH